eukprot:115386_1
MATEEKHSVSDPDEPDDSAFIKTFAEIARIVYENESKTKQMDELPDKNNMNLSDWNDWAQKYMLRPKGLERNDLLKMPNKPYHNQLLEPLSKLGLFDRTLPPLKEYSHFVIYGGTPDKVMERMRYCTYLLSNHQYICNKNVIYLCGERKCKDDEIEYLKSIGMNDQKYFFEKEFGEKMCLDEMNQLNQKHKIKVDFKVSFTPKPQNKARPNTMDTLQTLFDALFKETDSESPLSVLFISNSPYGPYQESVLQSFINEEKRFVNGSKAPLICDTAWEQQIKGRNTIDYLDSITRTLYNKIKIFNLLN